MQVDADFSEMKSVSLQCKPCAVQFSADGQYLSVGGTSKELQLYTAEGVYLTCIAKKSAWIWAVALKPASDAGLLQVACGCEDGSVSLESVSVSTVHGIYKV
jgi:intraflagellar transport protein 122